MALTLNNGFKMPIIGLGTWQSKPGEVEEAVVAAVESGYRHIDCASAYGNEPEVGRALARVIGAGLVKREDIFITSKLWNTRHHAEDVKPSLKETLTNLGLEYLDLYLIHWPLTFKAGRDILPKDAQGKLIYDNVHYLETWKALESCVDEGLVRSIGVSNFNSQQIQDVIDHSRIKPAVLQVEINPYFQQEKLVSFCKQRGVVVTAYSSFGSPGRAWIENAKPILEDATLVGIATRLGKSPAQVILRWLAQREIIALPKSVTRSRIDHNFKIFDFELSAKDMELIRSVDKNARSVYPFDGIKEFEDKDAPFYPFAIDF